MVKRRVAKKRPGKKYMRYRKRTGKTNTKSFNSNFAKITRLPFGQSQMCVLPYVEEVQYSTNVGVRGYYSWVLNNAYDPNFSGTGHQPLGYDQMTPIFSRYCVIGAQAKVVIWNRDSDERLGVGIHVSEQSTPPTNITALIEQGAIQYRILNAAGTNYGGAGTSATLYLNCSIKKFLKVQSLLDDPDTNVSTGSSPNRQVFLHVFCWQPDGGLNNVGGSIHVELRQRVVFNTPNNLAQS